MWEWSRDLRFSKAKCATEGLRTFGGAVVERRLSTWKVFPGNECVRVNVTDPADDGAPIFPLILAVANPSVAAMNDARATSAGKLAREMTADVMSEFFDGQIQYHVAARSSDRALGGSAEWVPFSRFAPAEFEGPRRCDWENKFK